jgi:hypothetical protein
MILKEFEVCKYSTTCPYNSGNGLDFCIGSSSKRSNTFTCNFVSEDGTILENKFRSKLDKTGNMKIIMESK